MNRDIDKKIASQLFGATENGYFQFSDNSEKEDVYKFPDTGSELLPYYSLRLESAFKALNMWLDSHPTYAVSIETVNLTTGRIYDVVLWGMDYEGVFAEKADTLPLAICNVLLSTLEEK